MANIDVAPAARQSRQTISDWTDVYEGLTNEEVAAIDHEVNTRADLTRRLT